MSRAWGEKPELAAVLSATGADSNEHYGQAIIHVLERLGRPTFTNLAVAGIGDGFGRRFGDGEPLRMHLMIADVWRRLRNGKRGRARK